MRFPRIKKKNSTKSQKMGFILKIKDKYGLFHNDCGIFFFLQIKLYMETSYYIPTSFVIVFVTALFFILKVNSYK